VLKNIWQRIFVKMQFAITYQQYNHQIKKVNDVPFVKDIIRNKWLQLTPEEWVRQNVLHYLINDLGYPKTLIAVEKQIKTHQTNSRFDIVVYNKAMEIIMLIECKEQNVPLNDAVINQMLNYQSVLQCKYIVVTNGNSTLAWRTLPMLVSLNCIPCFDDLLFN
jgi:hypothetical protein